jgi:hypothetical protein
MSISSRMLVLLPATRRAWLLAAAVAALVSFSRAGHAAPDFPTLLAQQLNMPCPPPCTICHQDLAGGFSTVVKPFGRAMMAAGLTPVDSTMAPALSSLEKAQTDSDGDGTDDVLELSAGTDPNGSADLCSLTPRYGCGAHIANSPSPNESAPVAAILTAAVLGASAHRGARRRRKRARAGGHRHNL